MVIKPVTIPWALAYARNTADLISGWRADEFAAAERQVDLAVDHLNCASPRRGRGKRIRNQVDAARKSLVDALEAVRGRR